jgi:hypothetical protein
LLFDVFICHASEDKDALVRPVAEKLREHHVEVWYDEFTLKPGDSLRRAIDKGLASSRLGVVVLSPSFFAKSWPHWELDGLVQRELAANLGADSAISRTFSRNLATASESGAAPGQSPAGSFAARR